MTSKEYRERIELAQAIKHLFLDDESGELSDSLIKHGSDLRKFRRSLGLSQTAFAKKCGYRRYNHISDMENGRVPVSAKMILAVMTL